MVIKKFWMILTTILVSGFFNLNAQGNGYWKLDRIETKNKEDVLGQLSRKVTGEAGNLVYTYDNGSHSKLVVKGTWTPLPEILNPNDEVTFSASLKINEFKPPNHHLSPQVSMSFVSWYTSGSIEEMKGNTSYCQSNLIVKATTTDDPKLNIPEVSETVTIKVPESPIKLKGEVFIIKVRMGSTRGYREYYYLYQWESGQAPPINIENNHSSVWKLDRIETKNKEDVLGQLSRKVTGEAGNLVYTYDNGSHSKLVVKGTWTPLPEILNPNDEVTFSASLKINEFKPPNHHLSPQVSMSFVSWYTSGSLEEMKGNTSYCQSNLIVKATTTDDPKLNIPEVSETVTIKVPESPIKLKGEVFIIKVRMGSTRGYREYYYLYQWQSGN